MTIDLNSLATKLKSVKSALIFCHVNPDGDTLSSAFSLKRALELLGAKADVFSPDGIPEKYSCLNLFTQTIAEPKEGYDAYIAVDSATEGQVGSGYQLFSRQKNTFVIDHHSSNTRFAKFNFVEKKAACVMLVYSLIRALGVELDEYLSSTLMVGLMTDTGNFSHSNTDAEVLSTAATFAANGADVAKLNLLLFKNQPKARAKLYVEVMSNMRFYLGDRLAIINVTQEQMKRYGLNKSHTEGFIDFPMTIGSVEVAVSLFEYGEENYKISFRSKNVDVNAVAATFGGGGHTRASGAMLRGSFEEVIDKLVFTVGNYL